MLPGAGVTRGVGVGVEVAVGDGVDVGPGVPLRRTSRRTWFSGESLELKSYPSVLSVSSASARCDPAAAATVEVRSTFTQASAPGPGVKVVIVDPFGGAVLYVSELSDQLVSATDLIFWAPTEPLFTHIQ